MQFLIIWHLCGSSDVIKIEKTQERTLLFKGEGTILVGKTKMFSIILNDIICCFENNEVYCLKTIAGPTIKCFLHTQLLLTLDDCHLKFPNSDQTQYC